MSFHGGHMVGASAPPMEVVDYSTVAPPDYIAVCAMCVCVSVHGYVLCVVGCDVDMLVYVLVLL